MQTKAADLQSLIRILRAKSQFWPTSLRVTCPPVMSGQYTAHFWPKGRTEPHLPQTFKPADSLGRAQEQRRIARRGEALG